MNGRRTTNILLAGILVTLVVGGFIVWRSTWSAKDQECWTPMPGNDARARMARCNFEFENAPVTNITEVP